MNGPREAGGSGRPVWADVEAAVQAALDRTNPKGQESVRRIFTALSKLRQDGGRVGIEQVGTWCKAHHGGPTTQSIRNNQRLVDIVHLASAVQAADALPRSDRPAEGVLLEQIGNPELRAKLEGMLAHRRLLIVENATLRCATQRIEPISFISREMAQAKLENLDELANALKHQSSTFDGPTFEAFEIAACGTMMERGLRALQWAVDASGEIVDRHGRTVAHPGVASAMRKVAGCKPA